MGSRCYCHNRDEQLFSQRTCRRPVVLKLPVHPPGDVNTSSFIRQKLKAKPHFINSHDLQLTSTGFLDSIHIFITPTMNDTPSIKKKKKNLECVP